MLMAALVTTTAVVVHYFPAELPLCFGGPEQASLACPAGAASSQGSDVLLILGLGSLGGVLAAAVAIRKLQAPAMPYDVPLALAVLKLPTGALTALAGLLLVGGGFVPGLSDLDSQQQILAYALLFGYAQQVATRLVDQHARTLLAESPHVTVLPTAPGLFPVSLSAVIRPGIETIGAPARP